MENWIDNSISVMQLNIGRLEVNCFDEDAEMSVRVGKSSYQSLSVDEAKELASFIVSHIKNETEANPEYTPPPAPIKTEGEDASASEFENLKKQLSVSIADGNTLAKMLSESYSRPKCTKPHCDCLWIEEKQKGGPVKSYPCLANKSEISQLKTKPLTPPPSPVGIDVEALAKEDAIKNYPLPDDKLPELTIHILMNAHKMGFENGFKAGYSASLPQSSTDEEKGERVFTRSEMTLAWQAGLDRGYFLYSDKRLDNRHFPDMEQYFKQKFNIDLLQSNK